MDKYKVAHFWEGTGMSQIVFASINKERLWYGRLEDAKSRLESARHHIGGIENDQRSGRIPLASLDKYLDAHDRAVRARADALTECARILEIYRALVLHGKTPG